MDKELFNIGFSYELGCGLGLLSQFLPLSKNSKLNLRFKEELTAEYSNGFSLTNEMYKQYFQATDYSLMQINEFINNSTFIGFNQGQSLGWEFLNCTNERITRNLSQIRENPDILNADMYAPSGIQLGTDLVYFQCNFSNPYGNRILEDKYKYVRDIINISFDIKMEEKDLNRYSRKGEFLNADNMAVFKINRGSQKGIHILVIDNNFSIGNVTNIGSIEDLFGRLKRENYKNMKKSNFSFISTDYHSVHDVEISTEIIKFADTLHDSSLMKMIQAGSYSYSLISFLKESNKFIGEDIHITLMGLKDNDFSIMKVPSFKLTAELTIEELMKFYERCSSEDINCNDDSQLKRLEYLNKGYRAWNRIPAGEVADKVRLNNTILLKNRMIQVLKNDTNILESDINNLNVLNRELKYTVLRERLENFVSTVWEIRKDHGDKIVNYLKNSKNPLLICNGSPGIGKTTSARNAANKNDKFLFMYFSPRTALGDDLEEKFKVDRNNEEIGYFFDDIICLTASSRDPENNEDRREVVRFDAQNEPQHSPNIKYIHRMEKTTFDGNKKGSLKLEGKRDIVGDEKTRSGAYQRVCKAVDDLLGTAQYNRIVTTLTLQACKKNNYGQETTASHLKTIFNFITKSPTKKKLVVQEEAYKRFCSKTDNVYIMIDEITGAEEGKALYSEIKEILIAPLEEYYRKGKERLLNLKVIVADASLVNSDIVKTYMESTENVQTPKVSVTDGYTDKLGVYDETIELNLGNNLTVKADIVNANCYPAKQLNIAYNILNSTREVEDDVKDKNFYKEVTAYEDRTIVSNCIKDIEKGVQSIIYIQHIRRLDNIIAALKDEACKKDISMKEGVDYIIINSNLSDRERQEIIRYNNQQNEVEDSKRSLKVILMTSSASRGISFKKAEKLYCVVQDYNIEAALMEIIQYIYRPRGDDERDRNGVKHIDFYLRNISYYGKDSEKELTQSKSLISTISLVLLLRGCILSRIYGYVNVNGNNISLVPLGGTGINSVNISMYEDIKKAMKEIRSEIVLSKKKEFVELLEFLEKIFSASSVTTEGIIFSDGVDGKNIYKEFVETMQKDLFKVLFFRKFNDFYYYNGMMIFPMYGKVTDRVHMLKSIVLKFKKEGEIILKILEDTEIKDSIRKPLSFIAYLMDFDIGVNSINSNYLTEKDNVENRFMAIPIQSFIYYGDVDDFTYEEDERENFGKVIESIIRPQANPYGVMPIVPKMYKRFPYVTFKSNDFLGKRRNMFNSQYVMTSTELNMMNLLFLGNKK